MLKDVLKKRKGKGVDLTIIMGKPEMEMEESEKPEMEMEESEETDVSGMPSMDMELDPEEIKDLMEKEAKGGKLSLMERVKLDQYRSKEKEA
jgi:hypothetical protein